MKTVYRLEGKVDYTYPFVNDPDTLALTINTTPVCLILNEIGKLSGKNIVVEIKEMDELKELSPGPPYYGMDKTDLSKKAIDWQSITLDGKKYREWEKQINPNEKVSGGHFTKDNPAPQTFLRTASSD